MKRCNKCNVDVDSVRNSCPLCGQILEKIDDKQITKYPSYLPTEKHLNILLRILLYLSILAIISTVLINFLTYKETLWSIYVVLGVLYLWVLLRSTIMSKGNIAGKLLVQMITVSLVCYGIELISDTSNWALDYVIPFVCIATILAILIISLIKKMKYNDYLTYLLLAVLISWVPLIFYFFDIIKISWPSVAAASLSIAVVLGMIVFADRATKDEIKKRFHV